MAECLGKVKVATHAKGVTRTSGERPAHGPAALSSSERQRMLKSLRSNSWALPRKEQDCCRSMRRMTAVLEANDPICCLWRLVMSREAGAWLKLPRMPGPAGRVSTKRLLPVRSHASTLC